MEEDIPQLAVSIYRKVVESYGTRLRNSPEMKLSEFCKETHTNYRSVIDWTKPMRVTKKCHSLF